MPLAPYSTKAQLIADLESAIGGGRAAVSVVLFRLAQSPDFAQGMEMAASVRTLAATDPVVMRSEMTVTPTGSTCTCRVSRALRIIADGAGADHAAALADALTKLDPVIAAELAAAA